MSLFPLHCETSIFCTLFFHNLSQIYNMKNWYRTGKIINIILGIQKFPKLLSKTYQCIPCRQDIYPILWLASREASLVLNLVSAERQTCLGGLHHNTIHNQTSSGTQLIFAKSLVPELLKKHLNLILLSYLIQSLLGPPLNFKYLYQSHGFSTFSRTVFIFRINKCNLGYFCQFFSCH